MAPTTERFPSSRYRFELALLFVALVAFAGLAAQRDWLRSLDRIFYDLAIRVASPPLDERLAIVGIDEQSLSKLGRWPWPRDLQAKLLQAVADQSPAAVLVDVVYSGNTSRVADQALADALRNLPVAALPVIVDVLALGQPPVEVLPYAGLIDTGALLGHVHLELDDDSISRGTYLYQGVGAPVWRHVVLELAEALDLLSPTVRDSFADCEQAPPQASMTIERCGYTLIPFAGPPGTVPQLSALDLVEGSGASVAPLQGRIVLVGLTTAGVADWVTSPVSGGGRPISGVEYNANLMNALIQNSLIKPVPRWLVILSSILIASIAALALPRLTPKGMLGVTALLFLVPPLLTGTLLIGLGWYLPLSAAALTVLVAYPYWSWRRHEIAWRYVDDEMLRLGGSGALFGEDDSSSPGEGETESERWRRQLNLLAGLLNLRLESSAPQSLIEPAGWAMHAAERRIDLVLPDAERYRLVAEQTASPFSAGEQELLAATLEPLRQPDLLPVELPGEGLAARIRLLQREAKRVREGRDTGLQALEQMRSGVLVVSPLGELEFANSSFLELSGLTAEALQSGLLFDRLARHLPVPLGRNWRELWRQVVLDGESYGFEVRLAAQRIGYVYCARLNTATANASPINNWAIIATDITEIRSAQSLREEALAFVSHDLRSPILSILALIRQNAALPAAAEIERYAQKSLIVSEQFLQLSRLESQQNVETYELDLIDPLGNALDQVYAIAVEAKVAIDRSALGSIDGAAWVEGNGELLERAFVNLLGNGIKYSDAGGAVRVAAQLTDEFVTVSFADSGHGIPPEDLPRLFEPYFRSSDPALARRRGSGLGLRFTKTVVERHGGEISVSSTLGDGSVFTLRFPRLPITADLQ